MTTPFDFSMALTLLVVCIAAFLIFRERAERIKTKRIKMVAASDALDKHFAALKVLDDKDTPVEILEYALEISAFICDAHKPGLIQHLSAERIAQAERDEEQERAFRKAFQEVTRKRPDLAAKFMEASIYGLYAYVQRWPNCAHLFPDMAVEIAVQPVSEVNSISKIAQWVHQDASGMAAPA